MKTKAPLLQSFRLQNFKAVRDSKAVKFTPLTVFIGDNGSGKSSLIEGLETLQNIVGEGLDWAMQQWRGFEHVWHQGISHSPMTKAPQRPRFSNPIKLSLRGEYPNPTSAGTHFFSGSTEINLAANHDDLFIGKEEITFRNWFRFRRGEDGRTAAEALMKDKPPLEEYEELYPLFLRDLGGKPSLTIAERLADGESLFDEALGDYIADWQFVSLVPHEMSNPVPPQRTGGAVRLAKDGSNLAEYLLDIRKQDLSAFEGIIETLRCILPYASDVQPSLTSELERMVYLQFTEQKFKIPGWMMSTGTQRIVALLALFRHPNPPPLIVIEEIENGLDPRTIHLIIDEIRSVVESGKAQVIITTHSPYLLDLLSVSQIVLVERVEGQPTFTRPADYKEVREWSKTFSPGKLYTMGRLRQK
ncbi:MAG: AAA family ATPase [Blastocatellales bacterium]|nr:AAA family ATPase [Blastocatellales bacterium]